MYLWFKYFAYVCADARCYVSVWVVCICAPINVCEFYARRCVCTCVWLMWYSQEDEIPSRWRPNIGEKKKTKTKKAKTPDRCYPDLSKSMFSCSCIHFLWAPMLIFLVTLKPPGAWKRPQKHLPAGWGVRLYTSSLLPRQVFEPQRPHNKPLFLPFIASRLHREKTAQNNSDNSPNNTKWLSMEFGSLQSRCLQNWLFLRPHMQDLSLDSP